MWSEILPYAFNGQSEKTPLQIQLSTSCSICIQARAMSLSGKSEAKDHLGLTLPFVIRWYRLSRMYDEVNLDLFRPAFEIWKHA